MILDEIDKFSNRQSLLYNILEWSSFKSSSLIIIFISNDFNFLTNSIPNVQSRMKFSSIIFTPYNSHDIYQILLRKYPEAGKMFSSSALTFICKTISLINSDIRLLYKVYEDVVSLWRENLNFPKELHEDELEIIESQP